MRFRTVLSLGALFVVCFTLASWATPIPERILPPRAAPYPDTQSQSGKVASVSDAAFSLEVTQGQERKTIEFLIDGNTKVEGQLEIGSHATVEYRAADGKNVAVHVVVAPASGLEAR